MRVTSIKLAPTDSDIFFIMNFRDHTGVEPYIVVSIDGLDAEEIINKYYGKKGGTGPFVPYYNLAMVSRQIVLKVQLNPDFHDGESYSSLRDHLYKMISASRNGIIELLFYNGTDEVANLSGWIIKFEAPHFERTAQVIITIKAESPMLRGALVTIDPSTDTSGGVSFNIDDNDSTAPHGFDATMTFTAAVSGVLIMDPEVGPEWFFTVTPDGGFLAGDVLHILSDEDKSVYVTRSGSDIYLSDKIAPGSFWPTVFPGHNRYTLSASSAAVWSSVQYTKAYWGI